MQTMMTDDHDRGNARAARIAEALRLIEQSLRVQSSEGERIRFLPVGETASVFDVHWGQEQTGRLWVYVPRNTWGTERVKFSLQAHRAPGPRSYAKIGTLAMKILELCRPWSGEEVKQQAWREEREKLEQQIKTIEGETGSITRYLHTHRMVVASYLVQAKNPPAELEPLLKALRRELQHAAEARLELASLRP